MLKIPMNNYWTNTVASISFLLALGLTSAASSTAQTSFVPPRDKPGERAKYESERLKDPATGEVPKSIRLRELQYATTLPDRRQTPSPKGSPSLQATPWTARGPFSVGGRTRALAIDVTNENRWMAGGATGGMWSSIDAGESWVRTTRNDQIPSVTSIAQDTRAGKTNVWYYGTGERIGSSIAHGDGIFKSTDNGLTWEQLPSTVSNAPHASNTFDYVWRVATDPSRSDSSIVYAAVVGAIFRSNDGGATWNRVLGVVPTSESAATMTDVIVSPKGVIYATLSQASNGGGSAAVSGLYRSTNGLQWTKIAPSNFPFQYQRFVPALVPSDEKSVFFLGQASQGMRLYKYTYVSGDGSGAGGQWTNLSENIPVGTTWFDNFDSQGSYNISIAVHPTNPNIVVIGGTSIFISTDGFTTQNNTRLIGGYNPNYNYTLEGWIDMMYPDHHSDIHYLMFFPSNPSLLLSAGDGGVHITDNYDAPTVAWIPRNSGYATSQFYTVAINQHQSGDQTIVGGLQDNHTWGSPAPGAPWGWLAGGDGSYCAIPPDNSLYYVSAQGAYMCRTTVDDNFQMKTINTMSTDTLQEYFPFIAPFMLDPNDPELLYLSSYQSIWRLQGSSGKQGVGKWNRIATGSFITNFSVSTEPPNILYFGSSNGVFRVADANQPNVDIIQTSSEMLPMGNVSCIAIDPKDANRLILVYSNYNTPSLFYTDDGGSNWTDISGNLEENPDGSGAGPSCNWAEFVHTPEGGTIMLVGTSVGLFSTHLHLLNGQQTVWAREGLSSIGMSDVRMIRARQSDGFIAVATHGGGIFTGTVASVTDVPTPVPDVLYLEQNYPNPCTDKTIIGLSVPSAQHVSLKVYDAFGNVVLTPVDGMVQAGYQATEIDTRALAAGRYLVRMEAQKFAQTRLLTVVR